MNRIPTVIVAVGLAISLGGIAQAQSEETIKARFAAADVDHDGKLTLAEALKGMPRVAAHFDKIDTDRKGYVTLDQIIGMIKRHRNV